MPHAGRALASSEGASALTALRAATASLHGATERHALLQAALEPKAGAADLAWLYLAFRDFYALVEPQLVTADLPASLTRTGYRYQPRLPLLEADLRDLAHPVSLVPGPCEDIQAPTLINPLGLLYVVEGSSQGGRLIAPRLRASLGVDLARGARYFHLFETAQWPLLRDWLSREAAGVHNGTPDSGCWAFTLLHRVFDRAQAMKSAGDGSG